MWVWLLWTLSLCQFTLGLTSDQVFSDDWQTTNIGRPIDLINLNHALYTLSSEGIISILDANNGEVLYRYYNENGRILEDSKIVKGNTDYIISYFNYGLDQDGYSKVILWDTKQTSLRVQREIQFPNKTLAVAQFEDMVYVATENGIHKFDLNPLNPPQTVFTSPVLLEEASIFVNPENRQVFATWEIQGSLYYSELEYFESKVFVGCKLAELRFYYSSSSNYFICNGQTVYEFDNYGAAKLKEGSNMVTDTLSSDLLVNAQIDDMKIIEDYVAIKSDNTLRLFNYREATLTPVVEFELPSSIEDSISHNFAVGDSTVYLITFSKHHRVDCYVNGTLQWSKDESLAEVKDIVVIDQDIDRFEIKKYMVVLSAAKTIGVFHLHRCSGQQLLNIFEVDVDFDRLHNVNNTVQGQLGSREFSVDFLNGKVFELHDNQPKEISSEPSFSAGMDLPYNRVEGYKNGVSTWRFQPDFERVTGLLKRSYDNEHVASNGIVLHDRSVLYKYLLPNTGVITTFNEDKNIVGIYLINLITGQLYGKFYRSVYTQFDPELDFSIVYEENFIIFSVVKGENSEVCVIDLFESLKPNFSLTKKLQVFSSIQDAFAPAFATQCFTVLNQQINQMAIFNTKYNIATKEIVCSTRFGQIFSIPKMVLDARRNGFIGDLKKGNNRDISYEDKKLPRISMSKYAASILSKFTYDPLIHIHPRFILSHHRKLISGHHKPYLNVVPTELESTAYVVYQGVDTFVTILRPSGSFDRLTSSFNFKIVIGTIILLILIIAYIYPKTERMKLLGLWNL